MQGSIFSIFKLFEKNGIDFFRGQLFLKYVVVSIFGLKQVVYIMLL